MVKYGEHRSTDNYAQTRIISPLSSTGRRSYGSSIEELSKVLVSFSYTNLKLQKGVIGEEDEISLIKCRHLQVQHLSNKLLILISFTAHGGKWKPFLLMNHFILRQMSHAQGAPTFSCEHEESDE